MHCAGSSKGDDGKARHPGAGGVTAGARHLVYISVVGADSVPMAGSIDRAMFGYFGAKFGPSRSSLTRACRGRLCVQPSSIS